MKLKRLFLAFAVLGLVLPALRQMEARTDISIDFFYDSLGSDGNWVELADYGYCWQPAVAVSNASWRPYADGYWAYTDVGWTWVSYEDFGWATYHYGRWMRLHGRGWVWLPGREWGPAWVSWRIGGDYVGWAPLPPRGGGEVFYDNSPITAQVDVQFDIGPGYYNFIDIRYIGEPVLRERIFAPEENAAYIGKTVNVTNITYTNSVVYNYGPDYDSLSRYSTRPIQRLSLQREADADPLAAARSKSVMKVQGDKLVIAAPQELQKPSKPVAPKIVKEKLAQAPIERGWEPVGDAKAQAELKQKIKAEDPKAVPPPSVKPREDATQSPGATSPAPAATTAPPATASPSNSPAPKTTVTPAPTRGVGPHASSTPGASPAATPPGKRKNARDEKPATRVTPSAPTTPANSPRPKGNPPSDDRERMSPPITPSSAPGTDAPQPSAPPSRDKGVKKQKGPEKAPDVAPIAPTQPEHFHTGPDKNNPKPSPSSGS